MRPLAFRAFEEFFFSRARDVYPRYDFARMNDDEFGATLSSRLILFGQIRMSASSLKDVARTRWHGRALWSAMLAVRASTACKSALGQLASIARDAG